jgi:hypothetical protein
VSAEDIATIISAVGDSWPAALALIAAVIGFVAWKALPILKDIASKAEDIRHQVHPNSGKSLRDAINRIEANGKVTQEALDKHLEQSAEVWAKVAVLDAKWGDGAENKR